MWLESFWWNHETQQFKEGIDYQQIPSFNDPESNIRDNYLKNKSREWSRDLAMQQLNENNRLRDSIESDTLKETHELLDKEALINEAKTQIYELCWISESLWDNSAFENFSKWFIDELLIWNYDMAIEVINTKWKIIIDALKQLATWEWLKNMAKSLWESIWDLFAGNAYEKWKSVSELWLLTTWVWLSASLWKKWLKLWMKQISKLRVNKETLVQSVDMKDVVWKTKWEIERIVPPKQFDFEKMLIEDIAKLWDLDRVEVWSFYLKRELTLVQQKAIIDAHNVWKNRSWAWINNYNHWEISQKTKILQEAWFSKEERRILLEKWVCWKEIDITVLDAEFVNNRLDLSDFENLSVTEKLDVLWIPKEFYDLVNNSWFIQEWFDIIERYKKLQYWDKFLRKKKPIDYQGMINESLGELSKYGIDKTDAMLLFASTDKYLFDNINWALRWTKKLTEGQIAFLNRFDKALQKMPDLEWRHIIRGDSHYSWITQESVLIDWRRATNLEISELVKTGKVEGLKQWDKILLEAYTYVANQKDDIFLWANFPDKDTLVIVTWSNWWIKDISALSMYKYFWDKLPWWWNTNTEWIIQRWAEVEFIDSRVLSNATFNDGTYNRKILVVRVKK